jgi:hypothetical protein
LREVLASKTKIFIVLELVTGGELFDKLVTEGRSVISALQNWLVDGMDGFFFPMAVVTYSK